MLVHNDSAYNYYLNGYTIPLPAGATVTVLDADWSSDDQLAYTIEYLDAANYAEVSSAPEGYPRIQNFSPSPGGGGGTDMSGILTAEVTLSDAQIKALGGETPVQIVAPAASGKFNNLIGALFVCDASAGAYTNLSSPTLSFNQGGGFALTGIGVQLGGILGGDETPAYAYLGPTFDSYGDLDGVNTQITLFVSNNGAGAFTGGNVANSARAKVWYTLEDLP